MLCLLLTTCRLLIRLRNSRLIGTKEESKDEEEVPAKTTPKPTASTKEKGKGIQFLDTLGYVATNAFSLLFFTKISKRLMYTLETKEFISKRNIDML